MSVFSAKGKFPTAPSGSFARPPIAGCTPASKKRNSRVEVLTVMNTRSFLLTAAAMLSVNCANANPFRANGVICNTPWEMSQFVKLWDSPQRDQAVEIVNKLVGGKWACASGQWLAELHPDQPDVTYTTSKGTFRLGRLLVFARLTANGQRTSPVPLDQYMAFDISKPSPMHPALTKQNVRFILYEPRAIPWLWMFGI